MAGGYTHQTVGTPDATAAIIRDMQAEINVLRRSITGLGIQIDGPSGDLIIGTGRTLTVNGDLDVTGNLDVPNGSITNPALTNPAAATAWKDEKHGFAMPASLTYYLTHTITPPSNAYTTAAVTLIGNGMASLSSSVPSGTLFLAPSVVNGSQNINLGYLPAQHASDTFADVSLSVSVAGVLTGVTSAGFDVSLGAEVTGGFDSLSGNLALSAIVIWLP